MHTCIVAALVKCGYIVLMGKVMELKFQSFAEIF